MNRWQQCPWKSIQNRDLFGMYWILKFMCIGMETNSTILLVHPFKHIESEMGLIAEDDLSINITPCCQLLQCQFKGQKSLGMIVYLQFNGELKFVCVLAKFFKLWSAKNRVNSKRMNAQRLLPILLYTHTETGDDFGRYCISSIVYWTTGFEFIHHIVSSPVCRTIAK